MPASTFLLLPLSISCLPGSRYDPTREISILRLCQGHPNIVRLHEVHRDEVRRHSLPLHAYTPPPLPQLHEYIVMELLGGGELLDRLRTKHSFTEAQASGLFKQLVSAVSFMHQKRVVHRDLKPEVKEPCIARGKKGRSMSVPSTQNLLFTTDAEDASLKVIDFGFARKLPEEVHTLTTPCYTLQYAAPEVLSKHNAGYTAACDLWSLGVILVSAHPTSNLKQLNALVVLQYTMLCGHAPFYGQSLSTDEIMERIRGGHFSFSGSEWEGVSKAAKDVIAGLLTVDAQNRLTLSELASHPWLTPHSAPSTPLQTSCVLGRDRGAACAINHTFHAFLQATKAGFSLGDVSRAPLAKRRKHKRDHSPRAELGGARPSRLDLTTAADPS